VLDDSILVLLVAHPSINLKLFIINSFLKDFLALNDFDLPSLDLGAEINLSLSHVIRLMLNIDRLHCVLKKCLY